MDEDTLKWGKMDQKGFLSRVIKKYNPKLRGSFDVEAFPIKGYVSGSIYAGEWSPVDMEGVGSYILSHGVVYEGHLKDGMFHGKGTLIYPMGQMVVGEWCKGEILSWTFKYKNIKQCTLDTYCKQPDRRFMTTLYHELLPAGKEYLTNEQPTRKIPEGCYDVVDGFYNPKTLWVHSSKNMDKVLYMPAPRRKPTDITSFKDEGANFILKVPFVPIYRTSHWIEAHCRKAWDETTGYKPELYEYWFSGRKRDEEKLNMRVQQKGGNFVGEESVCDEFLLKFEYFAERRKRAMIEGMRVEELDEEEKHHEELPKDFQGVKFASISVSQAMSSMSTALSSLELTSEAESSIKKSLAENSVSMNETASLSIQE